MDELLIRVQKTDEAEWECPNCNSQQAYYEDELFTRCYNCRANFDTRKRGTIVQPWIPLVSMEVGTTL